MLEQNDLAEVSGSPLRFQMCFSRDLQSCQLRHKDLALFGNRSDGASHQKRLFNCHR